ncbi:29064_t:CDS:2, partial [Racocetra persica]
TISDTNLSKNDLEAICCSLGISTEGTKADQYKKEGENEIHELDPKIETLREMVQKSREKTKILSSRIDTQVEEGQSF